MREAEDNWMAQGRLAVHCDKHDVRDGSNDGLAPTTCEVVGKTTKSIKLRVKGGQPAMPRGASWLAAMRNILEFLFLFLFLFYFFC